MFMTESCNIMITYCCMHANANANANANALTQLSHPILNRNANNNNETPIHRA